MSFFVLKLFCFCYWCLNSFVVIFYALKVLLTLLLFKQYSFQNSLFLLMLSTQFCCYWCCQNSFVVLDVVKQFCCYWCCQHSFVVFDIFKTVCCYWCCQHSFVVIDDVSIVFLLLLLLTQFCCWTLYWFKKTELLKTGIVWSSL